MIFETSPSAEDHAIAKQQMSDNGKCSCERVSAHVVFNNRRIAESLSKQEEVHRILKGDRATGYIGMQKMVSELYELRTGKSVAPDTEPGATPDPENETVKRFVLDARAVIKFMVWGIGILFSFIGVTLSIIGLFK